MKKVFKFVKGKKDEKKENGSLTPSQSGELASSPQTPDDEGILGSSYSPGYTVDFSGKDKTVTKLHKAAYQGNLEKVKSALKKVEIDAVDRHNRTALHFAVVQGHPSIVWFLLGNNAKTSICDENGYTPLLKSIELSHKECMALLLERGADVNTADFNGNTGLHIATKLASLDTVSSLLNKNANPEVSNHAGDYPLHIATKLENRDLLEILLCHGAAVDVMDRENRTPLMIAAKNGSFTVVDLLCKYGAQLNIVDSNGWTAEDYALLGGHENIAQLIKSLLKDMKGKYGDSMKNETEGFNFDKAKGDNVLLQNTLMDGIRSDSGSGGKITDKFFRKHSLEKEKCEETPDSPNAEVMPPFCQPPKSWEMIQAGMIDHNNDGNESKRRTITTLGTLHSRRGSFAECLGVVSPKHTLSLNRKKHVKIKNSFAKQRFSFNEEESLKQWTHEEKKVRKDLGKIEPEHVLNLEAVDITNGSPRHKKVSNIERNRSNEASGLFGNKEDASTSSESSNIRSKVSNTGTLGRPDTMNDVEEIWISNAIQFNSITSKSKEENNHNSWDSEHLNSEKNERFPSPPSAFELGIDMAKSKKYLKGFSVDPIKSDIMERNLWKNSNESHSLDCFDENPKVKTFKGHFRHESFSNENRSSEELPKCQKPCNKITDVNRRIKEELECYDDALRELAESSVSGNFLAPTFYAVNSSSAIINCQGSFSNKKSNIEVFDDKCTSDKSSTNIELAMKNGNVNKNKPGEKKGKKVKKSILLAMREVKHEPEVNETLSILEKLDEDLRGYNQVGSKASTEDNGENNTEKANSPSALEKLDTTCEKNEPKPKRSTFEHETVSTSVLNKESQRKMTSSSCQSSNSDSDTSETSEEKKIKHERAFFFSPLGAIYKEIVKERESTAQQQSNTSGQGSSTAPAVENLCNPPFCDDEVADFGSGLEEQLSNMSNEEDEGYHHDVRELSPDASLSSGPIEPLALEKDSGSDPDSSINDVTPTHKYFLKVQHEWLKCHLKMATEEKSKIEGLAAQLSEKAERLQFELADAKAATKSREEVIQLLQSHLSRMEIAYSKCLQESVQCRLELTAHEQEIHHLKQLCNKYEEQRDRVAQESIGKDFEQLQQKIITLEEDKEKMKKEIFHLEQENACLKERIQKMTKKSEASDQQCKERYDQLERLTGAYFAARPSMEERNFDFNEQEKARTQNTNNDVGEALNENKRVKNYLGNLEKETKEKYMSKLRKKEKEMQSLVEKFNGERESLIMSYEKKLSEQKSELKDHEVEVFKKESDVLKQMICSIKDEVEKMNESSLDDVRQTLKAELKKHCGVVSKSLDEIYNKDQSEQKSLVNETFEPKNKSKELKANIKKETRNVPNFKRELFETRYKNTIQNEILDLKNQINCMRTLLVRAHNQWIDSCRERESSENASHRILSGKDQWILKNLAKVEDVDVMAGEKSFVNDFLMEESSLEIGTDLTKYDWKTPVNEKLDKCQSKKVENLIGLNIKTKEDREISVKCELHLLEIKKGILSLKKQVLNEKTLRSSIESQVADIKLNLKLKEKPNLEREIQELKRKISKDSMLRTEFELLQHRRNLEWKKKKYLTGLEEGEEKVRRKMCQSLAKEREKSKEIIKRTNQRPKRFFLCNKQPLSFSSQNLLNFPSRSWPLILWRPEPPGVSFVLRSQIKHKLEEELNKSVMEYSRREHKKTYCNTRKMKKDLLMKAFTVK